MKLEKAIEIGNYNGLVPGETTWEEYVEAVRLLVEAGKVFNDTRLTFNGKPIQLLPGETEE